MTSTELAHEADYDRRHDNAVDTTICDECGEDLCDECGCCHDCDEL